MAELSTNVRYIKGIGETRAKALEKLGITTLRDLISYFPRSYEDRTLTRPIRDLTEGENVCVRAMIAADPTAHRIPGGRTIVRTRAVDETGVLDIVFFNQEYRKNSLHRGEIYIFYGKVEGQRRHQLVHAGRRVAEGFRRFGKASGLCRRQKGSASCCFHGSASFYCQ